MKTHEEVEV